MKLLIDNQLPAALATHLRATGHDAVHVLDIGLDSADDADIWAHCIADARVLISKDEDFVILLPAPVTREN